MLRGRMGRLLIVTAGGGFLALLIFVVLPTMNEPAPPVARDPIVAEILGTDERRDETGQPEERPADEGEPEGVMPVPSPLVGVRNDGEEVAVIFPAAEPRAGELQIAAEENPGDGLPQALSAEDVAEARAALEGLEPGPVAAVEPDSATGIEDEAAVAIVPPVSEMRDAVEARRAERYTPGTSDVEVALSALPAERAAAVEEESAPVAVAAAVPVERVSAGGDDRPGNALRLGVRKGEFDPPVPLDSRPPLEVSHPSGRVPDDATAGAAQAGKAPSGLPPRTVRAGVIVPGTLRGVMGYRLPLVSRQEVPDQIVSGVLIPAHTTFVIVQPGAWELVDLTAEEVQALRGAAARQEPEAAAEEAEKPWTLWRALRGRRAPAPE